MTNNPPIIADVFHRAGLIEEWGRGANRVIEMCKEHGAAPPTFEEMQGFLIVTFNAQMVAGGMAGTSEAQWGAQSIRVLGALSRGALSARALADALGLRSKTGALKRTLSEMLSETLSRTSLGAANKNIASPKKAALGSPAIRPNNEKKAAIPYEPPKESRISHGDARKNGGRTFLSAKWRVGKPALRCV